MLLPGLTSMARRVLLVAGALLLAAACRPRDVRNSSTPVRVAIVAGGTPRERSYAGTVAAGAQVALAFKSGGYIQTLGTAPQRPLEVGDRVAKNTVLASLRQADFRQRFVELAGMNAEASAEYRRARADHERAKSLFAAGAVSAAELDAARARVVGLSGAVTASSARASQASLALFDSRLHAPFDGVVLERLVEVGALVGPETPVLVLAATAKVKVVFAVPDSVVGTLPVGESVRVTTDASSGRVFVGTLTKVAMQADARTRLFELEATLDNADGALKVGMVGRVTIARSEDEAREAAKPSIPLRAVVPNGAELGVFVVAASGLAKARVVTLGALLHGDRVEVRSGLVRGERVVVQGATLLSDGARIEEIAGAPPE